VGATFLGLIAVLPSFFQNAVGVANLAIGGTGILIIVSVVLEFTREIESQLVMKRYEGFLRWTILVMGALGSGKGTQARIIAKS